jgi:hypothetical protein
VSFETRNEVTQFRIAGKKSEIVRFRFAELRRKLLVSLSLSLFFM